MKREIKIKPRGNNNDIEHLQEVLKISPTLANLLSQRNIKTFDEAKAFFRPELKDLHDPFLMKDMHKAVSRLEKAILKKERILIYGDYDVDGTTSVALTYSFIKDIYNNIDFYIPDRYLEGYGISFKSIDYAEETGVSLIIALDCGIKAIDKVEYANEKKIDFIICDHHTAGEKIPNAIAVLDPKRKDCSYPFKELSGCGVGFKFLQAYSQYKNIDFSNLYKYIDLVAVSVASDIVAVTGENRILTFFGLKKLNSEPLKGLEEIIKISGAKGKTFTVSDCVFKIGPRINAAGRIKSGNDAVKLLISKDTKSAKEIVDIIDTYNTERKELDRTITFEALSRIGNNIELKNKKTTVVYDENWHKGVVGIVASRLTETYYRPTIVLTKSNGMATGSARSVSDFNLYEAVNSCRHLLENFGGHKFAAGLTLKIENIETFANCFEKYVRENITEEQTIPIINADAEIEFSEITPKFYRILKQFAPFGPGNMSPVFISKNIKDSGKSKPVGQTKEHLKLSMIDNNNNTLDGIAFSLAHQYNDIRDLNPFTVCFSLDENEFRGKKSLQARVKEIQFE